MCPPSSFFSIRNQSCPNQHCSDYKKSASGNVVVHSKKGNRFKCTSCEKTWVAYKNEAQYGLRSEASKITAAMDMFKQGISIRKIAEHIRVSPSTIQRWKKRSAI